MTKPTIWQKDVLQQHARITEEHNLLSEFAMWLVPLAAKIQSPKTLDDVDDFNSAATDLWVKFNHSLGGTEQEQQDRIASKLFESTHERFLKEWD